MVAILDRRRLFQNLGIGALSLSLTRRGYGASSTGHGVMSLGLFGPTYYGGINPFLNWWKIASSPAIVSSTNGTLLGKAAWENGTYFDSTTGELSHPVPADVRYLSRIFFASPGSGNNFAGMQWTVKWDGSAIMSFGGLTAGSSNSVNNARGSATCRFGTNPTNTWCAFQITNVNDPPRNIRVFQAKYAANVANGEYFNPDWLAAIKMFGTLRFMGWMPTNGETISDFSQLADVNYTTWCQPFASKTTNGDYGPKGSLHPFLICQLANLTGCKIHVCIPIQATDAFVTSFATYFRDNTNVEVTYELGNEVWNSQFSALGYAVAQGTAIWGSNDGSRGGKWHGYQSARFMKIIRDVYNDGSRWSGAVPTQCVNVGITNNFLSGVNYWRTKSPSPSNSLRVSDLFKSVYVTGYFGDVVISRPIYGISQRNPGVVTSNGHGMTNGQKIKIFIQKGMTQLNKTFATVASVTANTFELSGVDTTGFTAYAVGNNYFVKSTVWDLMDSSNAKFVADPVTFPTKYTYFNQQIAKSMLTGTCDVGYDTFVSVSHLRNTAWPAQKVVADANDLDLRQYEGGAHFVGDVYLTGYGGEPQLGEYVVASGHSAEFAAVYAASYEAFGAVGGIAPSKFVEAGSDSIFGTWGGLRFIPGDEGNPVWQAVRTANGA